MQNYPSDINREEFALIREDLKSQEENTTNRI